MSLDHTRLAALGIMPSYPDAFGTWHDLDQDAARHLLRAMDLPEHAEAAPVTDAVLVTRTDAGDLAPPGELELEDGTTRPVAGQLPTGLPLGYHRLHRTSGGATEVIVAPERCLPHPGRLWGWAVQLYSLHSADSWGVGDLGDLRTLGRWSRQAGADVVLVNPLDDPIPMVPRSKSPYYPSSRRFRDLLYLRVTDVPGIARIADELPLLAAAARADEARIDRDAVIAAKTAALEALWTQDPATGHEPAFLAFRAELGHSLEVHATFVALAEQHNAGFASWPAPYHDPDSPAVAEFAAANADRIRFHAWTQWLLDTQLAQAAAEIPLMRDLPVGFDPEGSDAWQWQGVLAPDTTVGAPPDQLGPQGQDWQVPPFVPWKLRAAGFRPWIETLRAAFRHAASLRIDHVMGLFRLFWIPPGGARFGTFVRQPVGELLDILALESHRAGAYVVGEDLGTVEDGVRETLGERSILRYRVLWFENEPPPRWDAGALASVSTHDLPTVAGLWSGTDLAALRAAGAPADENWQASMRTMLREQTGLGADATAEQACVGTAEVLAGAGCDVVVAQLEDAVAADHRINVPGTNDEQRPDNWSLRLPVSLEQLTADPTAGSVIAALRTRSTVRTDDDPT